MFDYSYGFYEQKSYEPPPAWTVAQSPTWPTSQFQWMPPFMSFSPFARSRTRRKSPDVYKSFVGSRSQGSRCESSTESVAGFENESEKSKTEKKKTGI